MSIAAETTEQKEKVMFGPTELMKCLYLITKEAGGSIHVKREKVERLDSSRKLHISYDEKSDCYAFIADADPPKIIVPDKKIIT